MIQKKKFAVIGEWFRPDYYEEYKGYQFAISLSMSGLRDVAILLPMGVHTLHNYVILDEEDNVERNWFYCLVRNKFKTCSFRGYPTSPAKRQEFFVPTRIGTGGIDDDFVTFVRSNDLQRVRDKYAKELSNLNDMEREKFSKFCEAHEELEKAIDAEDSELVMQIVPEDVKVVYDFSQDDVIEITHEFIDELIKHDEAKANHGQILSKIKNTYESRRFKNGNE